MHITYGVYHPRTGAIHIVDTKEEALQLFTTFMIEFSREYFHNTMYLTIENNDDGTVTYLNDGNVVENQLPLEDIEALMSS